MQTSHCCSWSLFQESIYSHLIRKTRAKTILNGIKSSPTPNSSHLLELHFFAFLVDFVQDWKVLKHIRCWCCGEPDFLCLFLPRHKPEAELGLIVNEINFDLYDLYFILCSSYLWDLILVCQYLFPQFCILLDNKIHLLLKFHVLLMNMVSL